MITLVLGGARSGKSEVGERLAARHPAPVTYLATMVVGDDPLTSVCGSTTSRPAARAMANRRSDNTD